MGTYTLVRWLMYSYCWGFCIATSPCGSPGSSLLKLCATVISALSIMADSSHIPNLNSVLATSTIPGKGQKCKGAATPATPQKGLESQIKGHNHHQWVPPYYRSCRVILTQLLHLNLKRMTCLVLLLLGRMDHDFNLVTRNTFKTVHKHDTKTAKTCITKIPNQDFLGSDHCSRHAGKWF